MMCHSQNIDLTVSANGDYSGTMDTVKLGPLLVSNLLELFGFALFKAALFFCCCSTFLLSVCELLFSSSFFIYMLIRKLHPMSQQCVKRSKSA